MKTIVKIAVKVSRVLHPAAVATEQPEAVTQEARPPKQTSKGRFSSGLPTAPKAVKHQRKTPEPTARITARERQAMPSFDSHPEVL